MKRTVKLMSVVSSAVVLSSVVLAFSAEQMAMSMGDSTKSKGAVTATTSTATPVETAKLKPQATCPIQGEAINKKLFVDYKGKRIYVCCEMCLTEVKKDPEGAIKKLTSMGQGVETIASVKTNKTAQKKPASASDTTMKGMKKSGSEMKDMDMSKDTSMKSMDHSKM